MRSVLFVCTANICRSPMAEGVLRSMLAGQGFDATDVFIDSAGTHGYQAGKAPFEMAVATARRRGYDIDAKGARRIAADDFDRFDHILVMDRTNLANLRAICPTRCKSKVAPRVRRRAPWQGGAGYLRGTAEGLRQGPRHDRGRLPGPGAGIGAAVLSGRSLGARV